MGDALSHLFVRPGMIHGGKDWEIVCETLEKAVEMNITGSHEAYEDSTCEWDTFSGFLVLLFHMCVYGYVLYMAAELIGEGSELLLLVPSLRGLVGSVILPIMGAIPDGIMVLFSGLGEDAQEEVKVGMGALAGSTVMLLTIPWFMAVLGGRVDIDTKDGTCMYKKHWVMYKGERKKRKLGNARWSPALFESAVQAKPVIRKSGWIMVLTSLSYLIMEIPSFALSAGDTKEVDRKDQASFVEPFAIVSMTIALLFFAAYLVYCFLQSQNADQEDTVVDVIAAAKTDAIIEEAVSKGKMDVITAFLSELERSGVDIDTAREMRDVGGNKTTTGVLRDSGTSPVNDIEANATENGKNVLRRIKLFTYQHFRKYAKQYKDRITPHDFGPFMRDLGLELDAKVTASCFDKLIDRQDGWIHFKALSEFLPRFIIEQGQGRRFSRFPTKRRNSSTVLHPKKSLDRIVRKINADNNQQMDVSKVEDEGEDTPAAKTTSEKSGNGRTSSLKTPVRLDDHILGEDMIEDEVESDDEEEEHNEYYMKADENGEPRVNTDRVIKDAVIMMAKGSLLIFFFADPMVDALNDCGFRIDVSPFYISFIVAPLASNASEFLAAYKIALKKTPSTITVSFSTLTGAAIMNNTFVLAIFMVLVFARNLAWEFTAETFCILFVEWTMVYFASKRQNTLFDAFCVLSLFPLSLFIVYMMTSVGDLD